MGLMSTNSSVPKVLPNLPWESPEWKDLPSVYLMLIRHHSASVAAATKHSKFHVLSLFTLSLIFSRSECSRGYCQLRLAHSHCNSASLITSFYWVMVLGCESTLHLDLPDENDIL